MKQHIAKILPKITTLRHAIHAHPELRYEENITAALVVDTLRAFGYQELQTGVGGTGVVAVLDSGRPGKTVALRADMDALPMQEETGLVYQSQYPGKMHACGHDGHTASLLTCAYVLLQYREQFNGKIKFLFQPAEEGGAGAAAMIKDGALENPRVDAIFGYHNWPGMAVGKMGVRPGCLLAGTTDFKLTILGKGGHPAFPHLTHDPIYIAATIVQSVQSIVSRRIEATAPVVISITQFIGGTTNNIIPNSVYLTGTLRTTSQTTREVVKKEFSQLVNGIASVFGASVQLELEDLYPPTINSPAEADLVLKAAAKIVGTDNASIVNAPIMAAEDFAFYVEKIPGCYFLVGNGEQSPSLHNSTYNFCDEIIPHAAGLLCQTALDYLAL